MLRSLAVGLTLFSMFFGSGNLIYPLFVGINTNDSLIATVGFLITGTILPFIAVIAMLMHQGQVQAFCKIFNLRGSYLLVAALLIIWIPLGSGPRCITLAHAAITSIVYPKHIPLPIFSLAYTLIVFFVVTKEKSVVNILGGILTPILLSCLITIFIFGFEKHYSIKTVLSLLDFKTGLVEGYNTMDFIAAFFFTASLYERVKEGPSKWSILVQGSMIGIVLLAFVYVGMIYTVLHHAHLLIEVDKEKLFVMLSGLVLPKNISMITIVSMMLACMTTSIALTMVLIDSFPWGKTKARLFSAKHKIMICVSINFLMSLFGFEKISEISGLLLRFSYPILIILVCYGLYKKTATLRIMRLSS